MRTFDLSPLFRSTVGFDRLNDLLDTVQREEQAVSYPRIISKNWERMNIASPWRWPASARKTSTSPRRKTC